jgi:hypothetical protein
VGVGVGVLVGVGVVVGDGVAVAAGAGAVGAGPGGVGDAGAGAVPTLTSFRAVTQRSRGGTTAPRRMQTSNRYGAAAVAGGIPAASRRVASLPGRTGRSRAPPTRTPRSRPLRGARNRASRVDDVARRAWLRTTTRDVNRAPGSSCDGDEAVTVTGAVGAPAARAGASRPRKARATAAARVQQVMLTASAAADHS